ncbi:MAG: histidinol-phosphate transaminase [Elusimicrobiota bacterium]
MDMRFRQAIHSVESYVAGKTIEELRREFPGLRSRPVKLASNEHPFGPSPKALAAVRGILKDLHRYPEPTSLLLRRRLARANSVSEDQIVCGSGADDLLRLAVETFVDAGDTVVMSRHAFPRFKQNVQLMAGKAIEVPMAGLTHDLAAMAQSAIRLRAKAVFIANPNNPTGTYNAKAQVVDFLNSLKTALRPDDLPWVVLDEAYREFALDAVKDYPDSVPTLLRLYPRLLVVRTFSKIMGLAGLRVGYAVASDTETIVMINRARLIFNVSSVAQVATLAALSDRAHVKATLAAVREGRAYLSKQLTALGFVVTPSVTNFIFVRCRQGSGKDLYERLLRKGVIIRPMRTAGLEDHVRISVGSARDNARLVAALKESVSWS